LKLFHQSIIIIILIIITEFFFQWTNIKSP